MTGDTFIKGEVLPHTARTNPKLKGHDEAERILLDAWQGRLHHAWLITGIEGIGKATLAWRFARFILNGGGAGGGAGAGLFGEAPDSMETNPQNSMETNPQNSMETNPQNSMETNPQNSMETNPQSSISRRMIAGGHSDFRCFEKGLLNPKKNKIAKNDIPVDIARSASEFIRLTPAESDWRILLVDSADDLNENAANALLKVLEEPPSRALFLLVSHAPGGLLPTIRSRCRRLNLQPLNDDLLLDLLNDRYPEMDSDEKSALVTLSEGSIGKAINIAEAGGVDLYRELIKLMENAQRMDVNLVHDFADRLLGKNAQTSFDIFRTLLDWWFKRLIRTIATGQAPLEVLAQENMLIQRLNAKGNLALWLEVWEKMTKLLAQTDAPANLDKKQVVIGAFMTLETALTKAN